MDAQVLLIGVGLFFISILYSSVGHGGASGYLALLSLTTYGEMHSSWLKQHAWMLNLIVASVAFYHFHRAGHYINSKTIPFILTSIPFAFLGGYLIVDGVIYDTLLSLALLLAAYKLITTSTPLVSDISTRIIPNQQAYSYGAGIGFFSGIIGVGGGIFLSPIMVLKRWATPKGAAATATVFIVANSFSGLLGAAASQQLVIERDILVVFSISVLLGGLIGSKYGAQKANQTTVKSLLVLVLLIASTKRVIEVLCQI